LKHSLIRFTASIALLATCLSGAAHTQTAPSRDGAAATPVVHQTGDAAPVIFWNRQITVFRAYYDQLSPAQRATNAAARLTALPETASEWKIEAQETTTGRYSGFLVTVNGQLAFGLIQEDLDPESSQTLKSAADEAVQQLRTTLEVRARQRSLPLLLRGIGVSLAATLIALFGVWLIVRTGRRSLASLEKLGAERARPLAIVGFNLRPMVRTLERGVIKVTAWSAGIALAYLWLTFVLIQFPYTQPWGEQLGTFLLNLFKRLGAGVIESIPGLFTVLVIFLMARLVVRLVRRFFHQVEKGDLPIASLHQETARATRRLLVVLIWVFAVIIAYPYIPGSQADAFKGVSVFIGLMVSLGSAGLVNQMMSGLVVVYSRALKAGEYVKVGGDEGMVSEVGMLSTKIVTRKREEITIPNAVLVGTTTVNYSRLSGEEGAVVGTSVTIGYDAPWRQVHAMLLLAAERTSGVRKEPRPRVLQSGLADFYVEYMLLVSLDRAEDRWMVLSELHAQIQDAFNEFGVQIMSPHFKAQPADPVFVPKPQWFSAPANAPENEQ
jgi:small-conductance mechanosensitive channel